jgi:hypothetical protein
MKVIPRDGILAEGAFEITTHEIPVDTQALQDGCQVVIVDSLDSFC